jgi:hypothetical protein
MTVTNENERDTSAELSPKRKNSESTNTIQTVAKRNKGDISPTERSGVLSPSQLERLQEAFPVHVPPKDQLGRRGGISGPSG